MGVNKTLLKSSTGVCLYKVEETVGARPGQVHCRPSTLRPTQPRLIVSVAIAEEALLAEVATSKRNPIAGKVAACEGR